jgi:hypothetical protein
MTAVTKAMREKDAFPPALCRCLSRANQDSIFSWPQTRIYGNLTDIIDRSQ